MRVLSVIALVALAGCPATKPPAPLAAAPRTLPAALPTPAFSMPETETRTLSNGLQVVVATNDEVPLFNVRLVFNVGGWADPADATGLAEVTFDLLDDGAGDLRADDIARELKKIGSSLYSGANVDSSYVGASGLVRNLEPTLDLWTKVVLEPTFPEDEWTILKRRLVANLKLAKEDPATIAQQVSYNILYGDTYRGRLRSEADYDAITPDRMRAFYREWAGPKNAMIFVGGDITADEIVPLLEARIAKWAPEVKTAAPQATLATPDATRLYFIHKAGAAQSVVRVLQPIGTRADADWFPLMMANEAIGGQFTSRVNMNLREDKGYTYGARCFLGAWDGPGVWGCSASVQTDVTLPALLELKKEIEDALGDRPVDARELAYYQSMQVNGFPGGYETTGAILDEQAQIWRYGLPTDWPETYLPSVTAVTVESANAAFAARIDPSKMVWVVVGDRDKVYADLQTLGLEIVELDTDGNVVEGG